MSTDQTDIQTTQIVPTPRRLWWTLGTAIALLVGADGLVVSPYLAWGVVLWVVGLAFLVWSICIATGACSDKQDER